MKVPEQNNNPTTPHPVPSLPSPHYNEGTDLIEGLSKFCGDYFFSCICVGINLYRGSRNFMGGVIFITTVSLFPFLKNSYHSEKWSVFLKKFFRKWECISSCYLPISPNVLRESLRKASLFLIFEILPAGLFKCVWPFVTTQHELVNIILCFYCKSNEKVGEVGIS